MSKKESKIDKKKHASHLQLIDGGLKEAPVKGTFVLAEATNTRLMGVVGLHMHYKFGKDNIHQFFYFDAEEYGFDDYNGIVTDNRDSEGRVESTKNHMFGALGGKWVKLTESEGLHLVGYYTAFNIDRQIEFPEGVEEYAWLVEAAGALAKEPLTTLMDKICIKPKSDYELVNYYLMRCCGQDLSAVRYLCTEEGMNDVIECSSPATLFKNEITDMDTPSCYRCESLVEENDNFSDIVTVIQIEDGKIASARRVSTLPISSWEASLILKRPEFIIHCYYDTDKDSFYTLMDNLFSSFTHSHHEQGDLYVIYSLDNFHVRTPHYRLDQDTVSVVMLLDSGELIVEGQDPAETATTATSIAMGAKSLDQDGDGVREGGSYQFPDPILGLFIDSGFDRFDEFLEFAQNNSDED